MIYLTVVCALLVVALVASIVLAYRERDRADRLALEREQEWGRERRELLTRVQRPDLVPIPKAQVPQGTPRRAIDEIHKVGRVTPIGAAGRPANGDEAGDGA